MGLVEEEILLAKKSKKKNKKEKGLLSAEGLGTGVDNTDVEVIEDDKKKKKREKREKKLKCKEESVEEQERDVEIGILKAEKTTKKQRTKVEKEDGNYVGGEMKNESLDFRKDEKESDCEVELEVKKDNKKKKRKKEKNVESKEGELENNPEENNSVVAEVGEGCTTNGEKKGTKEKKKMNKHPRPSKRVKFSGKIEVFPISDVRDAGKESQEGGLVRGKRFSQEEDTILQNAVFNYIKEHNLGDDGLKKVLRCQSNREVKNCWKEISAIMPWRTLNSIYNRVHILFERGEKREWTTEEKELLKEFHEKHGADWRTFGDEHNKSRIHVKDTWRRICLPNKKKGSWSQDEYQKLFDLVNMDLRMKAFEEKKSKHGMLRDNISWEAISNKLSTRTNTDCCLKWYKQLESPLVREGKWVSSDDFRLLNELVTRDYSSEEEVDWDNLLDHRPGDICRKRWHQMVNHLGEHGNKAFADKVEVLTKRYSLDVLEARQAYENRTSVT